MEPSSPLHNDSSNIETSKKEGKSTHKNYKDKIAGLQVKERWGAHTLYLYEGFWNVTGFLERIMQAQDHFHAKPSDILLSSTIKTGTTWLKALAFAIVTRNRFDNISVNPLLTTTPHDCVPFLEVDLIPNSSFKRDPELPLLATHIPFKPLPRSILTSGCKIVYIYRDPKDAFVSLWHFVHKLTPKDREPMDLMEAFELFVNGISPYGPFWDHVLSYWKASLERPETILIIKYEDLMMDTQVHVKKLAEFMGYPFSSEEHKEGVVEKIVKLCSFENLSNLHVNKTGKHRTDSPLVIDNNTYFRKGEVGDWKNYLTAEMAQKMDQITKEKFGNCGLMIS